MTVRHQTKRRYRHATMACERSRSAEVLAPPERSGAPEAQPTLQHPHSTSFQVVSWVYESPELASDRRRPSIQLSTRKVDRIDASSAVSRTVPTHALSRQRLSTTTFSSWCQLARRVRPRSSMIAWLRTASATMSIVPRACHTEHRYDRPEPLRLRPPGRPAANGVSPARLSALRAWVRSRSEAGVDEAEPLRRGALSQSATCD